MRNKILSLLVLLLTAATGAWATDDVLLTTVTATSQTTYSQSPDGIVTVALSGIDNYIEGFGWVRTAAGTATVTVEATEGYTITRCVFKQNADNYPNRVIEDDLAPFVMTINGGGMFGIPSSFVEASDGQRKVTDMDGLSVIEVYGYAGTPEPGIEVTTNAASEGATFTEASFAMPAFDATAEYELVRDMSVQMTAQVGDGNDGYRIRLQKNEQTGKFLPADMNPQAMASLIAVTDNIEQKTLTNVTDYTVSIYALDTEDKPTGDAIAFQDLVPGRYVAIATAAEGSAYDGSTTLSNIFVLYYGYEVEVAAKEFVSYYKDEPLYADPVTSADAELYTISSINDDKAVLSSAIETAPSYTPLLVYNNSDQAKTILLIPANAEPNLALTIAPEFIGTLVATTIAASTANETNYALNGKQFVFVKNDISIAANKAWLSFETLNNAKQRSISIVFEEGTTGLEAIDNGQLTIDNEGWYDLNGRKLNGEPRTKGVFIKNGKKVMK